MALSAKLVNIDPMLAAIFHRLSQPAEGAARDADPVSDSVQDEVQAPLPVLGESTNTIGAGPSNPETAEPASHGTVVTPMPVKNAGNKENSTDAQVVSGAGSTGHSRSNKRKTDENEPMQRKKQEMGSDITPEAAKAPCAGTTCIEHPLLP